MTVDGQRHAPAALPSGKDTGSILQEAGWASRPACKGAVNFSPPGFEPGPPRPGGTGSAVGIATGYGLDGPGAHSASCTMGTGSFPGGRKRPGPDADPSPLLVPRSKNRVGLYLYSP
jgi:hypothetical protein